MDVRPLQSQRLDLGDHFEVTVKVLIYYYYYYLHNCKLQL
jgi:hypothetical protein